ncbi:MAG: hypothetical protein HKP61_03495 [Dactylosporangium sp.]|nr:hypothetical protein [Dactylosporangium sp.]NNJ60018.1 hypothetical protein [Dactylosporangium sp.]
MGSLDDVGAALATAIGQFGRLCSVLASTRADLTSAREEFRGRLGNTHHPRVLQACHAVDTAARQVEDAEAALRAAAAAARDQIARLGLGAAAAPPGTADSNRVPTDTPTPTGNSIGFGRWDPVPEHDVPDRIKTLGRQLPQRRPFRPGQQPDRTTGMFRGDQIESGGRDRSLAADLAPHRGLAPLNVTYEHVEGKVAARMRREHLMSEELVINNVVCGNNPRDREALYTCQQGLPSILPRGAKLTVWGTADGGATW